MTTLAGITTLRPAPRIGGAIVPRVVMTTEMTGKRSP
jgi:hypothetical protein